MEGVLKSRVYCKIDSGNRITAIDGGYTIRNIDDVSEWLLIDEGDGDRYNLCQNNYLDSPLYTDDGISRWKLVDGKPAPRTDAEINADRAARPESEPVTTIEDLIRENKRLAAQLEASIESSAMLEDCIAELAAIVYA